MLAGEPVRTIVDQLLQELQVMISFRRVVAGLVLVSMTGLIVPLPAQAGIVATEAFAESGVVAPERARLATLLARSDLRAQLEAKGVRASDVQARIDALSDEEAAQLAGRIDSLPAGGDVIGAVVFVFLVLLVTDILGLTKVFPFTKPIK
jgi:hypothetical protein